MNVSSSKTKSGLSIRVILLGLIGLTALTAIGISGTSLHFLSAQEKDGLIINLAGRQRMLSQKMSKEAMALASGLNNQEFRQKLEKTSQLFETTLKGLLYGSNELNLNATHEPEIRKQLQKIEGLWNTFNRHVQTLINSKPDSQEFKIAIDYIKNNNLVLLKEMNAAVMQYQQSAQSKIETLEKLLYIGSIIAVLVFILCAFIVNGLILRPIQQLIGMIQGLQSGDLNRRLNMNRGDEIGVMAATMDTFANDMQDEILHAFDRLAAGDFTFVAHGLISQPLAKANASLNDIMGKVQAAAEQISGGADQISDTSQALSQATTEQASSLEQITSSMADMSSRTKQNSDNAAQVNQLTNQASNVANKGNNQMQEMVVAMENINSSTKDISRIIKVIDEIAFQTNLLALNAAVEAAHAGQHGKGFAVVAEEVRNLAARSAKAASETASLIEDAVAKTGNGTTIAENTAEALHAIVDSTSKVSDLVNEIVAASNEQSQGISQISIGLSQIDEVTQQNTSNAVESAATSEQLAAQSAELREMLAGFTLNNNYSVQQFTAAPANNSTPTMEAPTPQPTSSTGWGQTSADSAPVQISLDDDDFGKF